MDHFIKQYLIVARVVRARAFNGGRGSSFPEGGAGGQANVLERFLFEYIVESSSKGLSKSTSSILNGELSEQ
jgi:hypothetical protein